MFEFVSMFAEKSSRVLPIRTTNLNLITLNIFAQKYARNYLEPLPFVTFLFALAILESN